MTLITYTELLIHKDDAGKYQRLHLSHVITTCNYKCTAVKLSQGNVVTLEIPLSPELIFLSQFYIIFSS
jgi:hypothetical protein